MGKVRLYVYKYAADIVVDIDVEVVADIEA